MQPGVVFPDHECIMCRGYFPAYRKTLHLWSELSDVVSSVRCRTVIVIADLQYLTLRACEYLQVERKVFLLLKKRLELLVQETAPAIALVTLC